jgi:hypothetical protein
LLVRAGLAAILLIRLRLEGLDAEAAGVEAFHVAAKFTLRSPCRSGCSTPSGVGCAVDRCRRTRRRQRGGAGCPSLVLATMIFLAREGAYFGSLNPR